MNTEITLNLPPNLDPETRAALEKELRAVDGVADAYDGTVRGMGDLATAQMVIELGASAVALLTSAIPLVAKILGLVKGHGMTGTITTSDGKTIKLEGTASDVQSVAEALVKTPKRSAGGKHTAKH